MKTFSALIVSVLSLASFVQAAPQTFKGYCMVVQIGNAPGKEVVIDKGTSIEIVRKGNVAFTVKYVDTLDEKDVFQMIVSDTQTKKQSLTDIFIDNEFPRRMDHVSAMGSISCQRD